MTQPRGPFRLVTVNTAPQRAKVLVGRVVETLKDDYIIEHVGNCECEQSSIGKFITLTHGSHRRGRAQGEAAQARCSGRDLAILTRLHLTSHLDSFRHRCGRRRKQLRYMELHGR
jgi:hypothetical protein